MRINPQTLKKLRRFRHIRRGYLSFVLLAMLLVVSLFGELLVSNRALVVHYQGEWYFPTYGAIHPGADFGLRYDYETNYRELAESWNREDSTNWLLMPPIPYDPYESDASTGIYRPEAPSLSKRHLLGTDTTSRDVLARLFYGTRIALLFSLTFMVAVYLIGIAIGCAMGYFGGAFDLIAQRLIEIWSNVPFLYMVIIVFSVVPDTLSVRSRIALLLLIMVLFSWTGMTYYMRTETYRERTRDYVAAARIMGASDSRIVFSHILPNVMATLITFMPFTVVNAISSVTALDFLGFGLPPPTPSLGELLKQGTASLRTAPWIVVSAFTTLVVLLTLITFIGEAVRESFDPKKHTIYR